MKLERYTSILLRLGLSIVFLFFGIDKFIHPQLWEPLVPQFLINIFSLTSFMFVLGIIEIILGALILVGFLTRIISILIALHLIAVILSITTSFGFNDIVARDIGLLFMVISLSLFKKYPLSLDQARAKTKK